MSLKKNFAVYLGERQGFIQAFSGWSISELQIEFLWPMKDTFSWEGYMADFCHLDKKSLFIILPEMTADNNENEQAALADLLAVLRLM